jgi:hypothetical protein
MTDASAPARRLFFVRSVHAGRDVELFAVIAVATVLIVRAALAASGWPQLGGGKIHFAHLLWGGLAMLLALILFMSTQGRRWKQVAVFFAGLGFGLFIDELGKFVTSDNDYFFQPAVAFIYLLFVVLFLVARGVDRTETISSRTALINAFDCAKETALHDLDGAERAQILSLLTKCDADDPVVRDLTGMVTRMTSPAADSRDLYQRLRARLRRIYQSFAARRWFKALLVAYLALIALVGLLWAVNLAVAISGGSDTIRLDFWISGQMASSIVSGFFIVVGFVRWRRSRLAAYRWFERALLVTIFVTEFFAFYQNQTTQFFGLVIVLLSYAAIRGMIGEEEAREESRLLDGGALAQRPGQSPVDVSDDAGEDG